MNKENKFVILIISIVTVLILFFVWIISSEGGTPGADNDNNGNVSGRGSAGDLVGKEMPDFELVDLQGNTYNKETTSGKNVILFFNEGIMCYPACWEQIAELSADGRLNNQDTVSVSVVVDSKEDWQFAIKKMPALANSVVAFDSGKKVSRNLGVLTMPSSMHYGSLPGHTYIMIDKSGIVRHVYDDPAMRLHNDQLANELEKL